MTRCEQFHDAMTADAVGEIEAGERALLASHVERCPACSRDAETLRASFLDLRAEPAPDPGPLYWASFGSRLRQRIAATERTTRHRHGLMVAAGLVAACGLALFGALRWPGRIAGGPPAGSATAGAAPAEDAVAGAWDGDDAADRDAIAEARLDAALQRMRGVEGSEADGTFEAILDDVAPGDPFAFADGLDEINGSANDGSGVRSPVREVDGLEVFR